MSSWFPTEEKPFLGNFVAFQADLLAEEYCVSFVRLLPQKQKAVPKTEHRKFQYIDVTYSKSKNPLLTYLSKKRSFKKALLLAGDVDIIHAHVSFPDGWLFRLAKKQLQKPMVLTEHGSYFAGYKKWGFRMKTDIPKSLKSADVIVAVSSFLAQDIEKRFPWVKPEVIGNPIDLKNFVIADKQAEFVGFLHISTLDEVKNVKPVIYAFAEVVKRYPAARLTIVSDEKYDDFQQLAGQLQVSDAVTFQGPVPHQQIPGFYQKANCLIMNSVYESFSIVIAEAWSSGIPVISTPVGIAAEMPRELGILTDGTQKSIEMAMLSFLETRPQFNSQIIRKHAENYSTEKILKSIGAIYERLSG